MLLSWTNLTLDAGAPGRIADILADELGVAVKRRGQALVALSGGRTPRDAYAELAKRELNWARITMLPSDERFVPPTDPLSNEGLLRATLGAGPGHLARIVGLWNDAPTVEAAAEVANRRLAEFSEPFDFVLLGMGEDGHTASLFPGAPELRAAMNPSARDDVFSVHPTPAAPPPPVPRLTLGLARLLRTERVMLLISGAAKRSLLETAMRQPDPARWPVAALFGSGQPMLQVICLE